MIGQTWPSEMRIFKDAKTVRTMRQLTQAGNNFHLYFTENSFMRGKNEIIFLSDRASSENKLPEEHPHTNIFRAVAGTNLWLMLEKRINDFGDT